MTKSFFITFLCLACLGYYALGDSSAEGNLSETGRWAEILRSKGEELREYSSQIDLYVSIVGKECSLLDSLLADTETRNYQIKFVFMTNMSSPFHYRLMRREYKKNVAAFLSQIDKVRSYKKVNIMYCGVMKAMIEDLKPLEAQNDKLKDFQFDAELFNTVQSISLKLNESLTRLNASLEPAELFETSINNYLQELDSSIPERIGFYYFQKRRMFVFYKSWDLVLNDLKISVKSFKSTLIQRLPNTFQQLKILMLFFVFAGIPAFVAGLVLIKKISRFLPPGSGDVRLLFFRSMVLAVTCMILLFSGVSLNFPENIILLHSSVILGLFSVMDFVWALSRIRDKSVTRFNSPFLPFFLLYSANLIFEMFDLCNLSLALLWPLTLLAFIEPLRRARKDKLPKLESVLSSFFFWMIFILLALSLTGYLFLSILIVFALVIFGTGLEMASNLSHLSRKLMMRSQNTLGNNMFKAIALGLAVPIIWSFVITVCAIYFTEQLLDPIALFHFMGSGIDIFGVRLNPMRFFSGIFLFFVFKTAINVLREHSESFASSSIDLATIHSIKTVLSSVIWGAYAIILLYLFGFSLTSITVIAGGLSLGVGFGLQNIVNNFVSGLIIIFGGTVRKEDIIQIDGTMAKVMEINVRSTSIQTFENAIISVPNADILTSKITNWTRNDPIVKKEIKIGVAYGSDTEKVRKILLEIATSHQHVMKNPEPMVLFKQFGDSTLDFSLFVWTNIDFAMLVLSDMHFSIDKRFRDEKISIAFPQLEIHVRNQQ